MDDLNAITQAAIAGFGLAWLPTWLVRPHLERGELRELLAGNDGLAIERQTKRLSQVTDAFAARRLDSTVKAVLAGRNLNEIEE